MGLLILLLGGAIALSPLTIIFLTSLAPTGTTATPDFSLSSLTLDNYLQAWQRGDFFLAFANSTFVALSVTALQLITASLAGYALARLRFHGRQTLLLVILATLVIPFQLLVIPIFLVLKWGSLINTYGALVLPTAVNGFSIFLMCQYFTTIPIELEEAAFLEGANRWQILKDIMLPLARPALVTVFLFTFIGEWNDLFKPLVFTTRPELTTVQLALSQFQEQFTSNWSLLMALIGQRQFIQGISTTGIKN